MASDLRPENVVWEPQPGPQAAFVACRVFECFFGGARGGGKTDAVLGEWAAHSGTYGDAAVGLMVRRTREQLRETFARARQILGPLGHRFTEAPMRCVSPGGARLTFAYLERDADADNYQGWSLTRVYVEEIGNFPSPAPILKLMATLRSSRGVPCRFRATGNPGGAGHQWVRARYIDPAPPWQVIPGESPGLDRIYIPSRIGDNRLLMESDPSYVGRLAMSGSPELVRAWLEGDWSVVAGAYFPEWGAQHVVRPVELPARWTRFRSMDWGSARPFSVGWWAVSDGELSAFPRGALIRYREWYGAKGPNEGLRMTAEQVAAGIVEREAGDDLAYGVGDPAMFKEDGGPSIAEMMRRCGVSMRPADNARLAGWSQVRGRLVGEDGRPMLYVFDTCRDTIRTLPAVQHDERRPEDIDTDAEDHAADEVRYACMSRPWVRPLVVKPEPVHYATGAGGVMQVHGDAFAKHLKARSRARR